MGSERSENKLIFAYVFSAVGAGDAEEAAACRSKFFVG